MVQLNCDKFLVLSILRYGQRILENRLLCGQGKLRVCKLLLAILYFLSFQKPLYELPMEGHGKL